MTSTRRWLTADEQATWQTYLLSHHLLMRALDQQLRRDSGLAHSDYGVLVRLSAQDGDTARITRLAELMDHSQSRMSHAVARLERAGLLSREPDAHDGRVVHVRLTAAGREALEAAAPGHVRCVRENLFDGLSPAQLAAFREVCTSMLDRLAPRGSCDG